MMGRSTTASTTTTMTSCLKNGGGNANASAIAPQQQQQERPLTPPPLQEVVGETVVIQNKTFVGCTSSSASAATSDYPHREESEHAALYHINEHPLDDTDGDSVDNAMTHPVDDGFWRKRPKNSKRGGYAADALDPEEAREARTILVVRILFSLLLMASAVSIACAVYFFVEKTEVREFENRYRSDADKLKESIGLALRTTLSSADTWAVHYVAEQKAGNTTFPFVSLPSFAIQAAKFKVTARAYAIGVSFIVADEERRDWESFAAKHGPPFVEEAWKIQSQDSTFQGSLEQYPILKDEIFTNFPELATVPEGSGPYLVWWQNYPLVFNPVTAAYNYHLLSFPTFQKLYNATLSTKRPVLSGFNLVDPKTDVGNVTVQYLQNFVAEGESAAEPVTNLVYPILSQNLLDLNLEEATVDASDLVGTIAIGLFWRELLRDILPEISEGIHVVTEEICETKEPAIFTYEINGATTTYLGLGDFSEEAYHHLESSFSIVELVNTTTLSPGQHYTGVPLIESDCTIRIRIYPSSKTENSSYGSKPVAFTISSVMVFLFAGILFALYDLLVKRRQRKVSDIAARSCAIVSDLFPKQVQLRLYEAQEGLGKDKAKKSKNITWAAAATLDRGSFSESLPSSDERHDDLSIADVYPSATVMYAGIANFARWSSNRNPKEVFDLLESLFGAFDEIARRQKIYKIENTGDTYVASCGVPKENANHAVKMARFATDCGDKSVEILRNFDFDADLGTSRLFIRFGLASGPVAGGILRGQRARFQLFGQTTLNAQLMERTGETGRIQSTEATADLLISAGKETWVNKRPDPVVGGDDLPIYTFWIHAKASDSISTLSVATAASKTFSLPVPKERMLNWFSDKLFETLKEVQSVPDPGATEPGAMDEMKAQIESFVEAIWSLHSNLPFHNFEKAFHVASALSKMFGQLTCLISPVDRFAVLLASLIYDVDHPGLDNEHLLKREETFHKGKSVTQLHAFQLSWTIFSDDKYRKLREYLCAIEDDFAYFSQLTQNCVIATDVMNPILSAARKRRWEQIFACPAVDQNTSKTLEKMDRKKTKTVLEHLMLVAHLTYTSQSWNFYLDWSGRLYQEMVAAFMEGKLPSDPADSWFNREMMLFDNVVLPLLDTLGDSGPCAAIGLELFSRASDNRDQWKIRGKGKVIDIRQEFTGEKRVHFA